MRLLDYGMFAFLKRDFPLTENLVIGQTLPISSGGPKKTVPSGLFGPLSGPPHTGAPPVIIG